jgi:hypothetical protein
MVHQTARPRIRSLIAKLASLKFCGVLALAFSLAAWALQASTAQQPTPTADSQPSAQQQPANQTPQATTTQESTPVATPAESQTTTTSPPQGQAAPVPETAPQATQPGPETPQPASPSAQGATQSSQPAEITEDEIRKLLAGKELFLRGSYLDNTLAFNEHGVLIGRSPQGSYTLSAVEINKVRLSRHKVELEGQRFALRFLGALPYEDPTKAVDRVNITPKKKVVKITIDRELVVKPKQDKSKNKLAPAAAKTVPHPAPSVTTSAPPAATPAAPPPMPMPAASAGATPSQPAAATETTEAENASEAQAEIAAAPPAERPADPNSVTTTISPAHANKVLIDAVDNVFAQGFDQRMMGSMPGFWKLYYEAAAAKTDYRPKDPAVLRQNMVDQKAKLVSTFEPASNQFAQDKGVAGISLYHVVIGVDGKPGEIAVARPIGFGLDEGAVDSIRKATFQPAIKDGKPVPVLLDLVVQFRIYSKRTGTASQPETGTQQTGTQSNAPTLPGPYSAPHQ